jgi:hypothetical protein
MVSGRGGGGVADLMRPKKNNAYCRAFAIQFVLRYFVAFVDRTSYKRLSL